LKGLGQHRFSAANTGRLKITEACGEFSNRCHRFLTRALNFLKVAHVNLLFMTIRQHFPCFLGLLVPFLVGLPALSRAEAEFFDVGVARVDITPSYPIRLSGYAARKTESDRVVSRLYAKALAIGSDPEHPAVLITIDTTGFPLTLRDEIVARLKRAHHLDESHITLCASHTHTAPCLDGFLPTLFGEELPPEHRAHIAQYTRELTDALEKVALDALRNRKPAHLSWGKGRAGFAANRRTAGGPVDQEVPLLLVMDRDNKLRAALANYACHCTTLGPETNRVCADWAGYAQEYLEQDYPGAEFLVAIGCGADANPQPRTGVGFAQQHGHEIEQAVKEILSRPLATLSGHLACQTQRIRIPLDHARSRDEWDQMAKQPGPPGFYARLNLTRLERGESLPADFPYLVQTWNFSDQLAMVFLGGEVVVDYSLRLKKEFDAARLWVNAYANDVPCYIPSERILREGGYEGGAAMIYYDKPNRIAPGVENRIVTAVHELLPKTFLSNEQKLEFPPPLSPEDSRDAIQIAPGLQVELVASEPLVVDPVAIDWGIDGKLWVAEMRDYPMGMDGKWKPGSRIKFLELSRDGRRYEKSTVFLDNLSFVTGVTAWGKGVLVCAAPDILYAEDTDGDGKADIVKKVYSGFFTDNYQARVNSLSLGLDNWIYGANGLLGGIIKTFSQSGEPLTNSPTDIRGRDFRLNPFTLAFEPVSGLTQQGRARDDWGNWFGCDNSTWAWHYPLADNYIRRNPFVAAPTPRVSLAGGPNPNLLYPISRTLERFNQPDSANHVTSGCGLGIYRDRFLGEKFYGNAFVCEPVHNLVHRLVLNPQGQTYTALRAPEEEHLEFLASKDNWFRPVQARTGPDGALYVVDMYRFVIEHPRWIPADRLAKLDPRAGENAGRIYRVVPAGKKVPLPRSLASLSLSDLARALDDPSGAQRDRLHSELLYRFLTPPADGGKRILEKERSSVIGNLEHIATSSRIAAARVQAACLLDGIHALKTGMIVRLLNDPEPLVVAQAIRLSEPLLASKPELLPALVKLADHPDQRVRFQLALSLGESPSPLAGEALGRIALRDAADAWTRSAVLSSAVPHAGEVLKDVLGLTPGAAGRAELLDALIATTAGNANPQDLSRAIAAIAPGGKPAFELWQLHALNTLCDALERKNLSLATLAANPESRAAAERLQPLLDWAQKVAADSRSKDALRSAAIRLLGRDPRQQPADLVLLAKLLGASSPPAVQAAVTDTLKRIRSPDVPPLLLRDWETRAPGFRQLSLSVLLSREEWISPLLTAIESGVVGRNEISPVERQRLLHQGREPIHTRAQALWKTASSSRGEIIAKYRVVEKMAGDASRGAAVFANNCAICHFLRGQGHAVGPNLAALADKTPSDFLTAILDPNAAVEPRFIAYNVDTQDGRSLSGIVTAESATTLNLIQGGGAQEKILKQDVSRIRASGLSLMPEGLEQAILPSSMADLIAFLKTAPRPFGSATPAQSAQARKAFLAGGGNGFAHLESAFDHIDYPSWMGRLPLHFCRQTDGKSAIAWKTAAVPKDFAGPGAYSFRLPIGMGYLSDPKGKFTLRMNGRPVLDFSVAREDESWTSPDGLVRMFYTVMEHNAEDSNGVLVIEAASTLLTPAEPVRFEVIGSAASSQRWFGIYDTGP
jgi:putative membrane-bound dehydrogenase-like protein